MAGVFDDVYNFLQAPANARKANEAARADAMANAPSFSDLSNYKVDQRLAPSSAGLYAPVRSNDTPIGMSLGSQPFGPPMAGQSMPSSMDLAAIQQREAAKTGGYAPWGAAGRSAFFNAMNGGRNVMADMPIDSDMPLNMQGPPMAPRDKSRDALLMDPRTKAIIGTSLFSMPQSIRGSSTGRDYSTGQFHSTSQYKYAPVIDANTGASRFIRVGAPDGDTRSSAERYAAANSGPGSVAEFERRASGNQSSGGGPAYGGEYASGGR